MENENSIEAWMFRVPGENWALLLSLSLVITIAILSSYFDFYLFIFALLGIFAYVRLTQAQYMGNAVRVHKSQFPHLYEEFKNTAIKLGINKAALYIIQDPYLNASTIGITSCTVVLHSALVEQLSEKELNFVIAHELGHFKAGHTKILSLINPLRGQNYFAPLFFGFWSRKAEYSADRCALAVTRDLETAISGLFKLYLGSNLYKQFNLSGFSAQLAKADSKSVALGELLTDHPLLTNRVKNILVFWKENFKTNQL